MAKACFRRRFQIIAAVSLVLLVLTGVSILAQIDLSEAILDFGVVTRPRNKTFALTITNHSTSPFLGSVDIEKGWLTADSKDLSLASGKSKEVKFTLDSNALIPGDYETRISFRDLMGTPKAEITAKCIIIQGKNDPILKIRTKAIDFKEVERGAQPRELVYFENPGSGMLEIKIIYPQWMKGEEQLEVHFSSPRPVNMWAFTHEFFPGEYTGEVKVESNGGSETIPVAIKVKPRSDDPIIGFDPKEVDFGTVKKGKKGRVKVKIQNKGKGRLSGAIIYPEWIEGDDEIKEIEKEKEVLFVADAGKLPLGLTRDTVRITSKDAGLADIPVKIYVKSR
ncbi:MAG: hypothetical protein RDV48_19535 [Candidatus Eremiobacteraeota bacterium]|nr:hypothetical protein [Candidatus Eremiobacteraeota bacterium]